MTASEANSQARNTTHAAGAWGAPDAPGGAMAASAGGAGGRPRFTRRNAVDGRTEDRPGGRSGRRSTDGSFGVAMRLPRGKSGHIPLVGFCMIQLAIAPLLLLISGAPPAAPSVVLILRDGSRIEAVGRIEHQGARLTFRNRAGVLYSIPAAEVEREISGEEAATAITKGAVVANAEEVPRAEKPSLTELAGRKLTDDKEKLLRQIEQNHSGTPAPPAAREESRRPVDSGVETARNRDEWAWRRETRFHEEALRRAQEDLTALQVREQRLEDEILSLTSLGYRPRQFSYQLSELVHVREQLEPARLEVARAKRALDEFMDDARRQDILPGWLR
jgi:hypothetical protein